MTTPRTSKKPSKPEIEPLAVFPIAGEFFRFHIGSRSKPGKKYLVDLEPYDWTGQCGCIHYGVRCEKQLKQGARACDALRCQHIRRAREYFMSEMLPMIKARLEANKFVPKSIISDE